MQPFIILHTNDIHGHVEDLARIATLVEQVRAENPDRPVLYFDGGDCEEHSQRLSSLTKGVAMHRLLDAASCDVATVGNGGLPRYGPAILQNYVNATRYPHLLANLRNPDGSLLAGAQATTLLTTGSFKLGVIGVTATAFGSDSLYEEYFGLQILPVVPLIRELIAELHQQGADTVVLLSHLGLPEDVNISLKIRDALPLIIGAHTHNLAPAGIWSGKVLIAQAGEFAHHLGRLDLLWTGKTLEVEGVSVIPITREIQPAQRFMLELAAIEADIKQNLEEVIGHLAEPLDLADTRECGVANLMADALRTRMQADVGLVIAGTAFCSPLPAGPLQRLTLWEACPSPGNPAVTLLSGWQLDYMIQRGLDLTRAAETPRPFRGQARGLMHLSGASAHNGQIYIGETPLEKERIYKIATTDWEIGPTNGYVDPTWNPQTTYDVSTILREAVEDYLPRQTPVSTPMGRTDFF